MTGFQPLSTFAFAAALSLALLSGCATGQHTQPDSIAWSHPMSGEFLFAYDRDQCAQQAAGDVAAAYFFRCMTSLGYYQIDPTSGAPVASLGVVANKNTASLTTSAAY